MSFISASTSRAALVAIALAAIAGCASLTRLALPEVRAAEVRVVVLDLPRVRLGVDFLLDNPNSVDIAVERIDAELDVEGARVAHAALAAPVTLPARAQTRVHIDATGDLSVALAGVARSLARGRGPLRYELAGAAQLADGRRLPFRNSGFIAL